MSTKNLSMFEQFEAALVQYSDSADTSGLTFKEKSLIGEVYGHTLELIHNYNIASGASAAGIESFDTPIREINSQFDLADVGVESIITFCRNCKVPTDQLPAAVKSVGLVLSKKNHTYADHFGDGRSSIGNEGLRDLSSVLGARSVASINMDSVAAQEAFGQDVDKMVTDIKLNIAVSILKFHKNIVDRVFNRKPVDGNVVQFQIPVAEVYDFAATTNPDSSVRNQGSHKVPFIDLYKNPEIANTAPKRLVPLKVNDTGSPAKLVADEIIVPNNQLNLLDLCFADKYGHNHVDWSDIISDGVMLEKVYITITKDNGSDPDTVETFEINVKNFSGSRFHMRNNAKDSADRNCVLTQPFVLNSETKTVAGTTSTILASFTADPFVRLLVKAFGEMNLKTADISVNTSLAPELKTKSGAAASAAIEDEFATLTFACTGYTVDARYSEENMRKTTAAVRMNMRPFAFEIPVGKNILVDYSLAQAEPSDVLSVVSQAIAVGNDIRTLDIVTDTIDTVFDRINAEVSNTAFLDYRDKVAYDYVAGMKVLPSIWKGTLDVAGMTDSVRSGDKLGDVRGAVEKYLLEMFAYMYNTSMFMNALDRGENAYFKCITSGPIMAALLNVPHYHDHLNTKQEDFDPDNPVEYRRVLPDGTRIEVVTSTFDVLTDKMIFVPFRPKAPESELSFGQQADRGTFVANFVPTNFGANYRRIATNSREILIPTNPLAAMLQVTNVSEVFEGLGGMGLTP